MPLSSAMMANTWRKIPKAARETVTYFSKSAEAIPAQGQPVANCHRKPIDMELVGTNEMLAKYGVVLDVWISQMGGVLWSGNLKRPKLGDVWQDAAGALYSVDRISILDMGQRFELTSLDMQNL